LGGEEVCAARLARINLDEKVLTALPASWVGACKMNQVVYAELFCASAGSSRESPAAGADNFARLQAAAVQLQIGESGSRKRIPVY
jgi:hypothetical protein